ncbi:MAG: class I SAM-dependent methyltransferase [Planctomycetota bacterium]
MGCDIGTVAEQRWVLVRPSRTWKTCGAMYQMTLQRWADNFAAAWGPLRAMTDERLMRAWWLYLNASRAVFASGRCQLWQAVITRDKLAPLPLTREGWLANKRKRPVRQRVQAKEPAVVQARSRR